MVRSKRKLQLTTLIIVGEGLHDKAFLKHMKQLYDGRATGQKIKIDSADGGSPGDIIKTTIRKNRHIAYDKQYILMDADIPLRQQDYDKAKIKKVEIILSTPYCLEGMLLDILKDDTSGGCKDCKNRLHPQLSGSPIYPNSYSTLFTKSVLDNTDKKQISALRSIMLNQSAIS